MYHTMGKARADQKRKSKSTSSGGANTVLGPRAGPADTCRMTVRMATRYNTDHTGAISSQAFGCNTPIAPCRTVTTGEVPSYLTWMRLAYDRGYVVTSRIRVQVINTTVADSLMVVLSHDGNTNVSTDIDVLAETRHARSGMVGYYSGGKNSIVFNDSYAPRKFQAMSWNSADNAFTTGDPANPYFWLVSVQSVAGGVGNIAYSVSIEYDIEFAELTAPPP